MIRYIRAAVIALAAGTLALPAAPAAAAPRTARIVSVSAENVKPGQAVRVRYSVTNTTNAADTAIVVVGGGLRCTTGCRAEPRLDPGRSQTFEATVVAPDAHPGEIIGLNISVGVRLGGQNSYDYKMVYVHGAGAAAPGKPAPDGVSRVTGRVRDTAGRALGGAAVTVRDGAGHEYRTTSDRNGQFAITSSAGKPIAAGRVTVEATLAGYRTAHTTVRGSAGAAATARLTLSAVTAPTEAAPSAPTEASPLAAVGNTPGPTPTRTAVSAKSSSSSPLFLLLGGTLVAAGLAALLLVVLRRRHTPAGDDPAFPPTGPADAPTAILPTGPAAGRR